MNRHFSHFFALLFFLLSLAHPPLSQASEKPTAEEDFTDFSMLDLESLLDTEVVVGAGFRRRISDIPAIVEVMQRERMHTLGVRDLYETLRRLTGVREDFSSLAPLMGNAPEVRGGGVSDRILLMIDDHPQLGEFDEVYSGYGVPVESIERVEFLRGPAAVLYGSSAMAGVLRVVTRDPQTSGAGAHIQAETLQSGGEVSVWGQWRQRDDSDAWRLRSDIQMRRVPARKTRLRADALGQPGTFTQEIDYLSHLTTLRNDHVYLRLQNHIIQAPLLGLSPIFALQASDSTIQLHGTEVGVKLPFGAWLLNIRTASDIRLRQVDFGRFPPYDLFGFGNLEANRTTIEFDGYSNEFAVTVAREAETWNVFSGLQYRLLGAWNVGFTLPNGSANPLFPVGNVNARTHDANLFAQGGVTPLEKLDLLAGFRLNIYKTSVTDVSFAAPVDYSPPLDVSPMGRAAIVYRALDQLSIKALYGRSFRLPTMAELYTEIRTIVAPNPSLRPEYMDTWELSFDTRPHERLSIRLNGFYNRNRDAIEYAPTSNTGGTEFQFQNNRRGFKNWGAELNWDWYATDWLNLFGGATFTEGKRYTNNTGTWRQVYMSEIPRVMLTAAARFSVLADGKLTITPDVYYRGHSYDNNGFAIVNATVRSRPLDWLELSLHVENIGNTSEYAPQFNGVDAPPLVAHRVDTRRLRLGITAEF